MRSVEEIRNEIAQVDAEIASIKSRIANAEKYGDVPDDAWTAFVDSGDRSGLENYRSRIENEKQREIDRARMAAEEKKAKAENVATAEYNLKKARAEYNQLERELKEKGSTDIRKDLKLKQLDWEKAYADYVKATGKTPDASLTPDIGEEDVSDKTGNSPEQNDTGKALDTNATEALAKLKDISSKNKAAEIQSAINELNSIYGKYSNPNDAKPMEIQERINELNKALEERKKRNAANDEANKLSKAATDAYKKMDLVGQEGAKKYGFTFKYNNEDVFVTLSKDGKRWVKSTKNATE